VATFDVSLVTPEGAAFEGEVEMIVVPGEAGEIGVLARHAPLVAMLIWAFFDRAIRSAMVLASTLLLRMMTCGT